jgi:hypothetical protein
MTDPAVARPFRERHLGHESRRHPVHAAHPRRVGERGALSLDRRELRAQRPQGCFVEARAHLAAVAQRSLLVGGTEQQRPERGARARGLGEADDRELLALRAADLQPRARAPGPVRRIGALGDRALDAALACGGKELRALAPDVVAEADQTLGRRPREKCPQQLLALEQRRRADVASVEVQAIEHHVVYGLRGALAAERVLERLEAGAALAIEYHHLAIEQRAARGKRGERFGDLREAIGPVELVARHEAHGAALDAARDPEAVELDLVQPLGAVGWRVDERRELERNVLRKRRAASARERRGIAGRADLPATALAGPARPDAIGLARDVVEPASGQHAARLPLDDGRRARGPRLLVAALDQEPARARAGSLFGSHPHQMPAAAQLLAGQREVELSLRETAVRIADRLPRAAIPHDDGSAAVLALRDHALEPGVLERMVLGLCRHAPLARDQARPLRNRPALQHIVELEAEVPVHVARGVLLHDELQRSTGARARCAAASGRLAPAARLWRPLEVAFAIVLAQAHQRTGRCRTSMPSDARSTCRSTSSPDRSSARSTEPERIARP